MISGLVKWVALPGVSILLLYILTSSRAFGGEWELSFNYSVLPSSVMGEVAREFMKNIEEMSKGQIKVRSPADEVRDQDLVVQKVRLGQLDMAIVPYDSLVEIVPEFEVFDVPFLFSSQVHAQRVIGGYVGRELLARVNRVRLQGLAFFEMGFWNIATSTQPISSNQELGGLTLGIPQENHRRLFELAGAKTISLPESEVLVALENRTLDGAALTLPMRDNETRYNFARYIYLTKHAYAVALLVMNWERFNQLPPHLQDMLRRSAQKTSCDAIQSNESREHEQLKKLAAHGVKIIDQPDVSRLRVLARDDIYFRVASRVGFDLLDNIFKERAEPIKLPCKESIEESQSSTLPAPRNLRIIQP